MAVYYATKAYVNSFSEALTSELAGSGITVTCLAPGATETEFDAAAGMPARRRSGSGGVADARSVAEAGIRGMMKGRRMVVTGLRNKLLIFAERFAPRQMVIGAVRRMQEKRRANGQA
jgi:short-subunit dehydrogenase